MTRIQIQSIYSPDIPDLEPATWQPTDPLDFKVLIEIVAGPDDGPGEEHFVLLLTTPRALTREIESNGPTFGRHHLVVDSYDWPSIRAVIATKAEEAEAPTWLDAATLFGRWARWEFEDMSLIQTYD